MKAHRARILAMQAVYQNDFLAKDAEELAQLKWIDYKIPEDEQKFAAKMISGVKENLESIDSIIKGLSTNWDIGRISAVNRAILRISIYQLQYMQTDIPSGVVIDEGLKLARQYAEPDATRFINGMLDAYLKSDRQGGNGEEKQSHRN